MKITESEFDKLVEYTLRIEFLSGKVFLYRIDDENKQYLISKLKSKAFGVGEDNEDADELNKPLPFLWFETSLNRVVVLNLDSITRLNFCYDYPHDLQNGINYYDNFGLLPKDFLINKKLDNEEEEQYLPQAIILHKGIAPEDNYEGNPLAYDKLSEGCLGEFYLELDGDYHLRQFINLTDNDGKETFMPLKQIVVMEFDSNLMYDEDEDDTEEDEMDEKDFTLLN